MAGNDFKERLGEDLGRLVIIIGLQAEYINLLGEELTETVVWADSHGWKSSRVEKGAKLRKAIKDYCEEKTMELREVKWIPGQGK